MTLRRRRVRALVASLAAAAALALGAACADLDALSRGGARPTPSDDANSDADPGRFCAAHLDDVFCDDFDDPGAPVGQKWAGIASVLPSPSRFGNTSFVIESPDPPSSAPFAIAFEATRNASDSRPFGAFAKELTNLHAPAVAMSVDVKVVALDAIGADGDAGTDAGPSDAEAGTDAGDDAADGNVDADADAGDAGDAGDSGDAGDAASRVDAASPPNGGLPAVRVPIVGMVALGATVGGVQVVASREGLFVVVGMGESTIVRARISELDYVQAASVAWTRINLVVGDPASVEAFAARESKLPVVCPRTTAAVAVWATLPPNLIQCVPAAPSYADAPERRLAATIGVGLESPSTSRILFDSVRIVAVPAP